MSIFKDVLVARYEVDLLESQYAEPFRYYHNKTHVNTMLMNARQTYDKHHPIMTAIAYHDVIYVPGSKNNERLSAQLFKAHDEGTEFAIYEDSVAIYNAILHTANHWAAKPDKEWQAHMLDLDLLGFASSWELYWENTEMLATEAITVMRFDTFIDKRIKFLSYISGQQFFRTSLGGNREEFEMIAQSNVVKELELLRQPYPRRKLELKAFQMQLQSKIMVDIEMPHEVG